MTAKELWGKISNQYSEDWEFGILVEAFESYGRERYNQGCGCQHAETLEYLKDEEKK